MKRLLLCLLTFIAGASVAFCVAPCPAQAQVKGTVTEPDDDAHNHSVLFSLNKPNQSLLFQMGSFGCAAPSLRVVLIQKDRFFVGCWQILGDQIHLEFENGQNFDIPTSVLKTKPAEPKA